MKQKVWSYKIFIDYSGGGCVCEMSNFTVERPDRHHLNQMIKVT